MIYFDSAATSIPCREAISAVENAIKIYGNPSSVHCAGLAAKKIIDDARKSVATALSCKSEEIIFTGSGSESNNQAIMSCAALRARRSKRIITTDSEHPSVSAPLKALEEQGWEVVRISTLGGELDLPSLDEELKKGAAFVSVMSVNNETGAKYNIAAVRRAIDRSGCGALLHCDNVQGFLKLKDKREIAKLCDFASVSAHKIGGLKGVGALFVKNGIKAVPFIKGGGQENGLRSGTENVAGIAAFGAACSYFDSNVLAHITEIYDYLREKLSSVDGIKLNIPKDYVPTVLSLSISGVRSEVMLNALNSEQICISAGSACSARKGVSHALAGFGLPKEEIESTVRISFGAHNTKEECDILAEKIDLIAKRLRR